MNTLYIAPCVPNYFWLVEEINKGNYLDLVYLSLNIQMSHYQKKWFFTSQLYPPPSPFLLNNLPFLSVFLLLFLH